MLIIGPPTADWASVRPRLAQLGSSEVFAKDIAPAVWAAAVDYGIDPVGMLAQSAHETGWGKFARACKAWHRNTGGLKVRDLKALAALGIADDADPLLHAQFATWRMGAEAQAQHLWAHVGRHVPPGRLVDPRYDWVIGKYKLEHFDQLGNGPWTPTVGYGQKVVSLAAQLQGG